MLIPARAEYESRACYTSTWGKKILYIITDSPQENPSLIIAKDLAHTAGVPPIDRHCNYCMGPPPPPSPILSAAGQPTPCGRHTSVGVEIGQ